MTTNTDNIDEPTRILQNVARPAYLKHERNGPYALDAASQCCPAAIPKACQQQKDDTHT
jgi:hypothetical protein